VIELLSPLACLPDLLRRLYINRWEGLLFIGLLHRSTRCIWCMSSTDRTLCQNLGDAHTRLSLSAAAILPLIVHRPVVPERLIVGPLRTSCKAASLAVSWRLPP